VSVSGTAAEVLAHPVFARRYGAVIADSLAQSTPPPPGAAEDQRVPGHDGGLTPGEPGSAPHTPGEAV